ncbi:hypothetical protein Ahy_B02g057452 [Arachis hypogaea]|uniref:Protein FAR1-RELATED SEQUENCE n=1 Tax=Arachis hypogaea TaxID=3818 RepID=A0A445AC04_ARAHY|nr:hypothetical protein Ahy_B02g057452 [Arachis hypogaea]
MYLDKSIRTRLMHNIFNNTTHPSKKYIQVIQVLFDSCTSSNFQIVCDLWATYNINLTLLNRSSLLTCIDFNTRCVVDEKFVPKVGMIFKTLEEVGKFYKHYSKHAGFSTKIKNTTRKGDEVKNQLIVCSREVR